MARINSDFNYSNGSGLSATMAGNQIHDSVSGQSFLPVIRRDGGHPFRPMHEVRIDSQTGQKTRRVDIMRDAPWLAWDPEVKKSLPHLDSADNLYFQHQLTLFLAEIDRVEYREVVARSVIPTFFANEPGMSRWEYMQVEGFGEAEITSVHSTDMPIVNVTGRPFSNDVRELRLAAKFSRQELLRAQFANKMGPISTDIQREKMEHVRLGLLMREEQIAWFGSEEFNLKGYLSEGTGIEKLFNEDNAPKLNDNASVDQMFNILDTGVTKVANTEIEKPNTLALGTRAFQAVSQKRTGIDNTMTVARAFVESNPWIEEIVWVPQLGFRQDIYDDLIKNKPAAEALRLAGGIGGKDVMMTWNRNSSRSRLIVAQDIEVAPPVINVAQETFVPQFLYTGGLEIKRPRAHHLFINI